MMTDNKRPPHIVPAHPGYSVAVPRRIESDRIASILWEPVIAWRIEQAISVDGEWYESVSPIVPNGVGSMAEEHPVVRYPEGRIVALQSHDLADENAVITYFQERLDFERSLRAKYAEKAKAD